MISKSVNEKKTGLNYRIAQPKHHSYELQKSLPEVIGLRTDRHLRGCNTFQSNLLPRVEAPKSDNEVARENGPTIVTILACSLTSRADPLSIAF